MPDPVRVDEAGAPRVLAAGPTFEELLATAFDDVRRSAAGNVTVFGRLLDALHAIGTCTGEPDRRRALAEHARRVAAAAAREVADPEDRQMLARRAEVVGAALAVEAGTDRARNGRSDASPSRLPVMTDV